MNKELLLFILFVVVFIIVATLSKGGKEDFPFKLKENFIRRKIERNIIYAVAEMGYFPAPKVRMADFMSVQPGIKGRIRHIAKISSRSVDVLVCDTEKFAPLVVVQVKGKRSDFIKRACEKAGVPYAEISPDDDAPSIREIIRNAINGENGAGRKNT